MGRKNIRIMDDVYKLLIKYKKQKESFSEAIKRLFTEENTK